MRLDVNDMAILDPLHTVANTVIVDAPLDAAELDTGLSAGFVEVRALTAAIFETAGFETVREKAPGLAAKEDDIEERAVPEEIAVAASVLEETTD